MEDNGVELTSHLKVRIDYLHMLRRIKYVCKLIMSELTQWHESIIMVIPGEFGNLLRRRYLARRLLHLGKGCRFGPGVRIYHKHRLSIGDGSAFNAVSMNAAGNITIGANCLMAAGVKIWSVNHRFSDPSRPIADQGYEAAEVVIGDDVWLASNVVVLPGVTIGRGSIVGAGSVVTKNVAPMMIVAGVPAHPIGIRGEDPKVIKRSTIE